MHIYSVYTPIISIKKIFTCFLPVSNFFLANLNCFVYLRSARNKPGQEREVLYYRDLFELSKGRWQSGRTWDRNTVNPIFFLTGKLFRQAAHFFVLSLRLHTGGSGAPGPYAPVPAAEQIAENKQNCQFEIVSLK